MNDQNDQANPYAAPASTTLQVPDEAELAGRGRRLGGAIIDGIIVSIVTFVPILLFFGGWAKYANSASEPTFMFTLAIVAVSLAAFLLVQGYFLATDSQTIGKKLLGMKIVRTDGSRADFARIVLRRVVPVYAVQALPAVGMFLPLLDVLFIFRSSKKCLHDDIADTIVIRV
jgi:uncharacterized RDD family membrane protein YckC